MGKEQLEPQLLHELQGSHPAARVYLRPLQGRGAAEGEAGDVEWEAEMSVSTTGVDMDQSLMAKCFNEWMRRFIEEPERFAREFQSVTEFQREEAEGKEPSYGESCAGYLTQLAGELG